MNLISARSRWLPQFSVCGLVYCCRTAAQNYLEMFPCHMYEDFHTIPAFLVISEATDPASMGGEFGGRHRQ